MQKNWLASLALEHRTAEIIAEQGRYGWKFHTRKAIRLLNKIEKAQAVIDQQVRHLLPKKAVQYGVTVEEPFTKAGKLKKMVTDWTDQDVRGPFNRVYFEDLNLNSDNQVKEYFLSQGWKPTMWNFRKKDTVNGKAGERTGPRLTDKETKEICENLLLLEGEAPKKIVRYLIYKHRRGLLAGLLDLVRPDGRISGEANPDGAATHRMRHRKIVNIPGSGAFLGTSLRRLFIAKDGYKIVGCDSKSNQVRMLCHYMNDPDYTRVVLEEDIHSENQRIAGLDTRSQAKTFIYGFLFGAGDEKIGRIVGGTSVHGKRLRQRFLQGLPRLARLVSSVKNRVERHGYVYGLDGRRVYISAPHKSLNYLLQSAEAIYMKYSQAFLWKWIKEEQLDAHFVATVHDEYQLEVRDDHVERVKELCLKAMLKAGEYLNINVPMEGDVHVGNNWSETH